MTLQEGVGSLEGDGRVTAISAHYRELHGADIDEVAAQCARAWMDPRIPQRQYEMVLRAELEQVRRGEEMVAPFAALKRCCHAIDEIFGEHWPRFLDVGAASGFVSELLKVWGFQAIYTAMDFSSAFREFALKLYPGINYDLSNANALPYHDDSFDVVLSAACLMHCRDYATVIAEAIRVSNRFIIVHRTPIIQGPTRFYVKEAYGVPCLEAHFNEAELFGLFDKAGATVIYSTEIADQEHRSYVLEKSGGLNHIQV